MNPAPASSPRRETIVVAALTLGGAILRFWGPGRLGLNHFDEGVYASAGLWIMSPRGIAGITPEVVSYGPPLFPALVGLSYLVFGISDVAAILVSQVAGVLTIPVAGWLGRRTFGPGAGAAAGALAAFSGPHVAFSRMALTDPTFVLCWLVALGLGMRFLERPGTVRAVLLGIAVGLAQNAKYNGYLAGMIVAATAAWGLVWPGTGGRKAAFRAIAFGSIAVVVSAAVYWPWYRFVEAHGGYAALMRHHRSYLHGPSRWPAFAQSQLQQAVVLSGLWFRGISWGAAAWLAAWFGCGFAANGPRLLGRESPSRDSSTPAETRDRKRAGGVMRFFLVLIGFAALGGWPELGLWSGLLLSPWLLFDRAPCRRLLAIAWLSMAVLTPFYYPYARLTLPMHALGWLMVAGLIVDLGPFQTNSTRILRIEHSRRRWIVSALVVALALWVRGPSIRDRNGFLNGPEFSPDLLEPTDSLRRVVESMVYANPAPPVGYRGLVRPPVAFYLALRGAQVTRYFSLHALVTLSPPGSLVMVDSAQLMQVRDSAKVGAGLVERLAVISHRRYRLSTPTSLDTDPSRANEQDRAPSQSADLTLFLLK